MSDRKCLVTQCTDPPHALSFGGFCTRHHEMWMEAWPRERWDEWDAMGKIARSEMMNRFLQHCDREIREIGEAEEIDPGFRVGDHVEDMEGDRSVITEINDNGLITTDRGWRYASPTRYLTRIP